VAHLMVAGKERKQERERGKGTKDKLYSLKVHP
jgi:hypothetical protein